jgi:4-amino-4-deoxy-L-arabinose transferase-like glycosyltransferase
MHTNKFSLFLGTIFAVFFFVLTRTLFLDADPWPQLDWSSGIWTDEGFYTYNARNVVLFGNAHLDQFNNDILMPVLDAVQRWVFTVFGVSLISARAISVVASLLTLIFFYDAMRRVWGRRIARTGTLFLGGEATYIFYNRLALMETPATLIHVLALWGLSCATPLGWAFAGAMAAGTIAFKTTYLVLLPLPIALWGVRLRWKPIAWYVLGAAVTFLLYGLLWGRANQAEILRMNNYYRVHQSQPADIKEAAWCLERGVIAYKTGNKRGMLHFFETRTPVLTTLGLVGILTVWRRRGKTEKPASGRVLNRDETGKLYALWIVVGLGMLLITRYQPTRYFLLVYPALAALAAVTLYRLPLLWQQRKESKWAMGVVAVPIFFLWHHLTAPLWFMILPKWHEEISLGVAALATFLLSRLLVTVAWRLPRRQFMRATQAIFLIISLSLWTHWLVTRRYETRDIGRKMGRDFPPNTVFVGSAPHFCLENRLRFTPIFRDLANGDDPIATFQPDYILYNPTPWPQAYWETVAPQAVRPENLVEIIPWRDFRLVLYKVPKKQGKIGGNLRGF